LSSAERAVWAAPNRVNTTEHYAMTKPRQPKYKDQNCTLTLAEALDEFYERNPDAIRATGDGLKDKFFRSHDTVHVVFGCDTTIRDEALADFWTIFGTDLGFRNYLKYLKPLQEDLKAIIEQIGTARFILQTLGALPFLALVYWRTRKMRAKWYWVPNDDVTSRSLAELRTDLNIKVFA